MNWILIILPVVIVIIWIARKSNPINFARDIAKVQYDSHLKIKSSTQTLPKRDLYIATLRLRPGYSAEKVEKIIQNAEKWLMQCKQEFKEYNNLTLNLRCVAYALVFSEYNHLQNKTLTIPTIKTILEVLAIQKYGNKNMIDKDILLAIGMMNAVDSAIPEEL